MRRSIVIMALVTGALVGLVLDVTPAFADRPVCPATSVHDFVGGAWQPSARDVLGVRAPINMRTDGGVCEGGPEVAQAVAFISIQDPIGGGITQIGFDHIFDTAAGSGRYCRFWAIGSGQVHPYLCGNDSNDTTVFFLIVRFSNPVDHTNRYSVQDCGTSGGYDPSHCFAESSTQLAYAQSVGTANAESSYSVGNNNAPCTAPGSPTVVIMGSSADMQKYGTTNFPLEGMNSGLDWGQKNFAGFGPTHCTDYTRDTDTAGPCTRDTRNG